MKLTIESQTLEKQPEIDVHAFSIQIGNAQFTFVEGTDGILKVYGDRTVQLEPRGSNSFYMWSV